jgi:hypothetical protein
VHHAAERRAEPEYERRQREALIQVAEEQEEGDDDRNRRDRADHQREEPQLPGRDARALDDRDEQRGIEDRAESDGNRSHRGEPLERSGHARRLLTSSVIFSSPRRIVQ